MVVGREPHERFKLESFAEEYQQEVEKRLLTIISFFWQSEID